MKTTAALVLIALQSSFAFGCNPLLQSYPVECALQDKYQKVTSELQSDFGVDAEKTVAYRAMRLIELEEYESKKREVNYMPWKIYAPAPATWILWEKGAAMVEKMVADPNRQSLSIDDIEALNEALISKEMMTFLSKLKGNKPGRVRTSINFLPPGTEFKCSENPMSAEDYQLMSNYDLKDYEGNPLIRTKSFKKCKNGGYGGQLWFLASSKVGKELQRWADDFNTNLQKYLTGAKADVSPLEFIIDSQRWFIAIHPFGDGNGRTSRFIQDFFLKKLGLPFMPTGRISMLSTREDYLRRSKREVEVSVKYLNSCLSGYQKRQTNPRWRIDGHCYPLYQDLDTGERQHLKDERVAFGKELTKALSEIDEP